METQAKKEILEKYLEINEQLKVMEAQRKLLQKIIKEEVKEAPGFEVIVNQVSRETFNYSQAKEKLAIEILAQMDPFVKTTEYETLTVKKV